jgi:hypothetical protein
LCNNRSAMARLPKDANEAVEALGVRDGATVIAVGPDHGFVEALAEAIGNGKLMVQAPPPDLEAPKSVEIVESVPDDATADAVLAWVGVVPVHAARELGRHVGENGSLWLVLPKADRDSRAPVTEGDVKRAMLSAGWREQRVVPLSTESFAVSFRRRR